MQITFPAEVNILRAMSLGFLLVYCVAREENFIGNGCKTFSKR